MSVDERFHSSTCHQSGEYKYNVRVIKLPPYPFSVYLLFAHVIGCAKEALTTQIYRLIGGVLMLSVGVLYLLFEKSILSSTTSTPSTGINSISTSILGAQMGLIVLAMLVTRSSVQSLQARRGLPLSNQIVGWLVLSTLPPFRSLSL